MDEGYSTFDHTGDLGLVVWARSPERLHELAAVAVLAQVVEVPAEADLPAEVIVRVDLDGDDPADLFVHWLNTALLQAELHRAVWTRARVLRLAPGSLQAELSGPRFDPSRQSPLREVKAVSHHGLELDLEPPACHCRLVLDL